MGSAFRNHALAPRALIQMFFEDPALGCLIVGRASRLPWSCFLSQAIRPRYFQQSKTKMFFV